MSQSKWAKVDEQQGSRTNEALELMGRRHQQPVPPAQFEPPREDWQDQPHSSQQPAQQPGPKQGSQKRQSAGTGKQKPRRPNGTTRSWYMPTDVAEDLNAATDELYHDLRGSHPKRVILGALIRHGLKHREAAKKELQKSAGVGHG